MKRDAYLAATEVQLFLSWARPFVTGERPLLHEWSSPKLGWPRFETETLVDAYPPVRLAVQLPRSGRGRAVPGPVLREDGRRA